MFILLQKTVNMVAYIFFSFFGEIRTEELRFLSIGEDNINHVE